MYGTTEASAAGGTLAATGLATGSMVLAAVGLVLAGIAVIALLRKNGKNKP